MNALRTPTRLLQLLLLLRRLLDPRVSESMGSSSSSDSHCRLPKLLLRVRHELLRYQLRKTLTKLTRSQRRSPSCLSERYANAKWS